MKSFATNTIKEMNTALVAKLNTKPTAPKTKKGRIRMSHRIKSRELVESDSDSDEQSTEKAKLINMETKTISKDPKSSHSPNH